jgi:hypothetical protein
VGQNYGPPLDPLPPVGGTVFTLNPVAVTGLPQQVNLPMGLPNGQALIANESPYYFAVAIAGKTRWLAAWSADVFDLVGSTIQFTPQLIGSLTNAPSQNLLITLADGPGAFPGTYPLSLDRQTSIAAGTVLISGNPSVSILGTPTVSIPGGVAITGTPNVAISGTPAVTISGTPNFNVTNASISVQNATGTQLQTTQPQVLLGTLSYKPGSVQASFNLPAGCHSIALVYANTNTPSPPAGGYATPNNVVVKGNTTGAIYLNLPTGPIGGLLPDIFGVASGADAQINVLLGNPNPGVVTVQAWVIGILDTAAVSVYNTADTPVNVVSDASTSSIRIRDSNNSGIVLGQQAMAGSLPVVQASDQYGTPFSAINVPAGNVNASATQAAGGAGKKIHVRSIEASIGTAAGWVGPLVTRLTLTDGAVVIWEATISLPAGAGNLYQKSHFFGPEGIVGSANTAMILAIANAAGANSFESVSMEGFTR